MTRGVKRLMPCRYCSGTNTTVTKSKIPARLYRCLDCNSMFRTFQNEDGKEVHVSKTRKPIPADAEIFIYGNSRRSGIKVNCPICGKEFMQKLDGRPRTCSVTCRNRSGFRCACGKPITVATSYTRLNGLIRKKHFRCGDRDAWFVNGCGAPGFNRYWEGGELVKCPECEVPDVNLAQKANYWTCLKCNAKFDTEATKDKPTALTENYARAKARKQGKKLPPKERVSKPPKLAPKRGDLEPIPAVIVYAHEPLVGPATTHGRRLYDRKTLCGLDAFRQPVDHKLSPTITCSACKDLLKGETASNKGLKQATYALTRSEE